MKPSANAVDQSELILSDKSEEVMPCEPAVEVGQTNSAVTGDAHPVNPRELVCLRCAHEWLPRKGRTPKCCPFCLSAYWSVPFKRFTSQKDIKAAQAKIRERVTKDKQEKARKALRNRLERSARKLGPEALGVVKSMYDEPTGKKGDELRRSIYEADRKV